MDEETIQDFNEAAKRFSDALSAAFKPAMEWADRAAASLAETVNAILEEIQPTPDIMELRRKAQEAIEKRKKNALNGAKWHFQ